MLNAANVLRATGLSKQLAIMAQGSFKVMANVAETIGTLFHTGDSTEDIARTISHLNPSTSRQGWEGVKEISAILQSLKIDRADRLMIIRSFVEGSIEARTIPAGTSLFRWHDGNNIVQQFGRYFSFERIENPIVARALLSLADVNQMTHLDRFNTIAETRVFVGTVAPLFNHPGGATQVFITGPLKQIIEVIP